MNPFFGVFLHGVGGFSAGSFYIPFRRVRKWAWESYWLIQGVAAWLFMPALVAALTTRDLWGVLARSPANSLLWAYLFGVLWGFGGLTFGLSMRYLGMSLGYALTLGFCAAFGTLIPPIFNREMGALLRTTAGWVILAGVGACLAGIAVCGYAGVRKERELTDDQKRASVREYALTRGFFVALFSGVMSACFAFAISAGEGIAQEALAAGIRPVFQNNPVFILIMAGGFTTNCAWCLALNVRNRSIRDYVSGTGGLLVSNYLFSALAGIIWYGQFFFYGMGTTKMGRFDFSSWSIHMAFIIVFSNLWGIAFKEWRRVSRRTWGFVLAGLALLILSTVIIGWGNFLAAGKTPDLWASVRSPDGRNELTFERIQAGGRDTLVYSVIRDGKAVIGPSTFRVTLAKPGSITEGLTRLRLEEGGLDETFPLPLGKCGTVRNHCATASLRLESASGVVWDLDLRAYDDGVAFRYGFPVQDRLDEFVLAGETTEFRLEGDPQVLCTSLPDFTSSHENLYRRMPLSELPGQTLFDQPFLAVWPGGPSAALTEARLRDFAGMYLERIPGGGTAGVRATLSPLPSRPEACVIGRPPHWSPWRVVLLADQAGRHLESSLLVCLNDPPRGDFSWLRPGKTTWHWWDGTADEKLPLRAGMRFEYHRSYIDFCARSGIAYHSVIADDRPWYRQTRTGFGPGPETDILNPCPELDLPKILEYAAAKGVGIRLWVHWRPLEERLEEAFTRYEEWGIGGLMVDFLDRNDQEMVRFCERVLESAARHRLHIQFHGSYVPSGEQRTFPHLANREGALNLEYLKWSDRCTPGHNVNVAYTRLLAGPTDYHLGGFRAVPPDRFEPRSIRPTVLGSRCHHLALYVVYENWMPMVCDTPSAYSAQPGFEFIREVPTTWNETRFLAGCVGESVVVARRKGEAWWIGGITNETGRELEIPLSFLGPGTFDALLFLDGSLSQDDPNAVRQEKRGVSARESLRTTLAPGGGIAGVIRPKAK